VEQYWASGADGAWRNGIDNVVAVGKVVSVAVLVAVENTAVDDF
jgi:hypothetical protein